MADASGAGSLALGLAASICGRLRTAGSSPICLTELAVPLLKLERDLWRKSWILRVE